MDDEVNYVIFVHQVCSNCTTSTVLCGLRNEGTDVLCDERIFCIVEECM